MSTVLAVDGARKTYGGTRALDGASMHLNRGEWLALLGPNGAGKTTMIRAIAGRVRLDAGTITLLGQTSTDSTAGLGEARLKLGIVPQDLAIYPLLTAEENLRAFGQLNGVRGSELKQRIAWALEWTGLGERARSLARTFSGGMKRRLNIACGVLHKPEVVLLDEPTVGVDPQSRERIWQMLSMLRQQGASLLLTTHQLDEAQRICDRITIIDHGRTIADGTMEQLVASTIGPGRRVLLQLEEALAAGALSMNGSVTCDGNLITASVMDVAGELPPLLLKVREAGGRVNDVRIESPSLHNVFLHLTGRELRE